MGKFSSFSQRTNRQISKLTFRINTYNKEEEEEEEKEERRLRRIVRFSNLQMTNKEEHKKKTRGKWEKVGKGKIYTR